MLRLRRKRHSSDVCDLRLVRLLRVRRRRLNVEVVRGASLSILEGVLKGFDVAFVVVRRAGVHDRMEFRSSFVVTKQPGRFRAD